MAKNTVTLPVEVAKEYELVNWKGSSRQYFGPKLKYVDVSNITLGKAAWLVKNDFRFLKKKGESKNQSKAEK